MRHIVLLLVLPFVVASCHSTRKTVVRNGAEFAPSFQKFIKKYPPHPPKDHRKVTYAPGLPEKSRERLRAETGGWFAIYLTKHPEANLDKKRTNLVLTDEGMLSIVWIPLGDYWVIAAPIPAALRDLKGDKCTSYYLVKK